MPLSGGDLCVSHAVKLMKCGVLKKWKKEIIQFVASIGSECRKPNRMTVDDDHKG